MNLTIYFLSYLVHSSKQKIVNPTSSIISLPSRYILTRMLAEAKPKLRPGIGMSPCPLKVCVKEKPDEYSFTMMVADRSDLHASSFIVK